MAKNISWTEYLEDVEEFQPYLNLLQDADEFETAVKYLFEFPNADYLGEQFQQEYFREVRRCLKWFKKNTKIKEVKEEVVTKIQSYKYIDYEDL